MAPSNPPADGQNLNEQNDGQVGILEQVKPPDHIEANEFKEIKAGPCMESAVAVDAM